MCIGVYIYRCMYVYTCIRMYVGVHVRVCVHVCKSVFIFICVLVIRCSDVDLIVRSKHDIGRFGVVFNMDPTQ